MNANERQCLDSLSERVIGAMLEVSNTLGAGFLEKVVGEYFADLMVEDVLVGKLKAHRARCGGKK